MNNLIDTLATVAQKTHRSAAAVRSRRKAPAPAVSFAALDLSQEDSRLHVEGTFTGTLRPVALVAWAGEAVLAEFPVAAQGPDPTSSGREVRETWSGTVELETVIAGWNSIDFTDERTANAQPTAEPDPATDETVYPADRPEEADLPSGIATLTWRFRGEAGSLPVGASRIMLHGQSDIHRAAAIREMLDTEGLAPATTVSYHRGVGHFGQTHMGVLQQVNTPDGSAHPYINRRGYVAIAMNRALKPSVNLRVDRISASDGVLRLSGAAYSRHSRVTSARLLVVGRRDARTFTGPATFTLDERATRANFGRGTYTWNANLDFRSVDWSLLDNASNYDLWVETVLAEEAEPRRFRVNRTPYVVRSTTRSGTAVSGRQTLVVNPYYTFKAKATSLILEVVDTAAFSVLDSFQPAADAVARRGRRPIWLVGELPYKAQDNGLHFFRYLRAQHPEIDAYYVIERDSPERSNLAGLDHVLDFGSPEHFQVALRADRFIGTHHADYLYPTRHPAFKRKAHGVRVFLQHGVMGTKWMVPNYGKRSAGFSTDLFLVSSAREQEYIVGDFGYDMEETAITGLPRFDALFSADQVPRSRQLLVIPTWRDWLQSDEAFAESEYLREWNAFLRSPELAALVSEQGLEVVFCLHPNMQRFRHYFAGVPARIVSQGEIDVQSLMKQSAAMVTDYSSVGFDFSFLGRPVLYFQFDRSRFLGRKGSHLDLDRELPGKISTTVAELLADVQAVADRGFTMTDEARRRSRRFLAFADQNNCERVFAAVSAARSRRGPAAAVGSSEFVDRVENKLRRSRYYFPAMKAMQSLARRLPMQRGLMVFESGLGKQYADSPRYIYEELLRRGDDRPKVWIYSGRHKFTDPQTKTVKRLSPSYFWYLARANYWVTNQNLPYYMTRRSNAIYLQTWHGTPLKHMLHDLEEIHGRDEGYMERVDRAISQWTHLLSPSPYATEVMRSAFAYSGEVIEEGYPRNDLFFGDDLPVRTADVRAKLGLDDEAQVVLYAPTFRDNASNGRGRFTFELPFDLEEFNRRFGESTVLLLRMHVLVSSGIRIPPELRGRILDVSGYPEIQELYLVSDVLVTDYSSVFFDFAVLGRPIVFFAYDLELYRDTLRGFYLDYLEEVPGSVVQTEEDFYAAVERALDRGADHHGLMEGFRERFAPRDDGRAAARVVDRLF